MVAGLVPLVGSGGGEGHDRCYRARRAGASLLRVMFSRWEDGAHANIWEALGPPELESVAKQRKQQQQQVDEAQAAAHGHGASQVRVRGVRAQAAASDRPTHPAPRPPFRKR